MWTGANKNHSTGGLPSQARTGLSIETMSMKMSSLTKKKVKKKVTSSDKISPQTIRIKVSHLKNHTYIYFAFLEIVIEVHIT